MKSHLLYMVSLASAPQNNQGRYHTIIMLFQGDGCITISALLSREKRLFLCHFVQCMQDSSHCYMERVFMSSLTSLKSIAKRNQINKLHSLILMQWVLLCLWSHVFFVAEHVSFIDAYILTAGTLQIIHDCSDIRYITSYLP